MTMKFSVRLVALSMLAAQLVLSGKSFAQAPAQAQAPKRIALVVGNSAYQHTSALENPRHDATDISAVFKSLGFQVVEGLDLDKRSFDLKLREFVEALPGAAAAVFFYAGHGLQVAGRNYLVPTDAKLTTSAALDFEMVPLDVVHRSMEREATTNILFVDACRNNPLARNLARAMGTRSAQIGSGLSQVEAGVGTLISFSTQPGNVALDGTGRNSPFVGALIRHIKTSDNDLGATLIAVRNDVMKETENRQVPWENSALTGQFYFKATARPSASQSGKFDGEWRVVMNCPKTPDGALGFERRMLAHVQNGALNAQAGVAGNPNSLKLEGKIADDGGAVIHGIALSGRPETSVGGVPPGTRSTFFVVARFEGMTGSGKRHGVRDCDFVFGKK